VVAELVQQDILEFLKTKPGRSFDFISAMNILEHLSLDTLLAVVRECRRTLRPGGSLVGMVPNATSPFGGMTRYWDLTHQTAFTPSSLRHVANAAGFDVKLVSFKECGPRVHGVKSLVRVALWRVIRQAIKLHLLAETASTKGGIYTSDMLFRFTVGQS
jgi:SAM-dependent methyltransferase